MSDTSEPLTPMSLREKAGVTQRQVAATLDVTVGTVSSWERRVKVPNLTLLEVQSLCELYQCSVSELQQAFGHIQVRLDLSQLHAILELSDLTLPALIESIVATVGGNLSDLDY